MRPAGAPQTHLGEEPPPLPDARPEVGGAAPLRDRHGRQRLLPLGQGPVGRGSRSAPPGGGGPAHLPAHSPDLAPGFFPELRSSGVTSPRDCVTPHPHPAGVWRRFRLSQVGRALLTSGGEKPGRLLEPLRVRLWAAKMWLCEGWGISRYRVFRREKVLGTTGRGSEECCSDSGQTS